jgi:mono/diheme cytochrome c family protein/glucose/arabinose dehydrogenase
MVEWRKHRRMRRLALLPLLITSVFAQLGDKAGEAQIEQVPPHRIPPAPGLSPEDEAKTFQIAPGFRIELVAAEPLIGDPVAVQFGPDGRLWVVEMRSYMPDLDGRDEDKPTGRVVVLTDVDGDGRMDKSDVFLDQLVMPRAVCVVGDGALIGAPPMLWYCPDKNGDGKADEKIEVTRDFGIQVDPSRPELANPERAPNSPLWALDNWIYCGAYAAKFRFRGGSFERGVSSFRGQWGLSQDDFGRLFHNSNSDHLRADIAPSHYLIRNPHFPRPAGANVKIAAEQFVWPIRVNPGINRGYRPEMLRDHRLKEFTAACAPWVYRGGLLGCDGDVFTCEPSANLVSRDVLTAERGTIAARPAYVQREFLASQDERFRPVNLTTGPDGALYVVDFYRGVIQHRISLTTYLRKQSEERGLADPRGLGRIWRIVPEGSDGSPSRPPNLAKLTSAELVPQLAHANSWTRETAQRLLVERNDASVVPALEQLALKGAPLAKLHALWTLDGMQKSSWPVLGAAVADPDARVRNAAVRCSETLFAGGTREIAITKLIALTETETDPQVQLQLVLTLGEARDAKADIAMTALAVRAAELPYLADAVLSGVSGREIELLEHLLAKPDAASPVAKRLAGGLARSIAAERDPERISRFLTRIQNLAPAQCTVLLGAFAFDAVAAARRPVKLDAKHPLLDVPAAKKVATMLTWPGKPAPTGFTPPRPLNAEERTRFETGKALYAGVCAACHQPNGMGLDGLAPPLLDSEWVLGSHDRLTRIALHGVRGPLKVKGSTYQLDMPPMGIFGDEQLAAILTYIRREWEHGADPISPEQVKAIRAAESKRQDSWTQEELLKLP